MHQSENKQPGNAKPASRRAKLIAYMAAVAACALVAAISLLLLAPLPASVFFLALQCLLVVFFVPVFAPVRPDGATFSGRLLAKGRQFLRAACPAAAAAAAALLISLVTQIRTSHVVLSSLFALTFGLFLAGLCSVLHSAAGLTLSQVFTLAAGLAQVSTPYYINPFIHSTSGAVRMRIVQLSIDINPLLVGASGILQFDWLRSPYLYQRCLIGGYQYPFYYPSALKTGIFFAVAGVILIAVSALRKYRTNETPA